MNGLLYYIFVKYKNLAFDGGLCQLMKRGLIFFFVLTWEE